MEEWANEIGLWKRSTESRSIQLETEAARVTHEIAGMKTVVEAEFTKERTELTALANQSRESITALGIQTRTELQNFQTGLMGEVGDTQANLHNLRKEAADAITLLATSVESSKAEHQALRAEAERVVGELRSRMTQRPLIAAQQATPAATQTPRPEPPPGIHPNTQGTTTTPSWGNAPGQTPDARAQYYRGNLPGPGSQQPQAMVNTSQHGGQAATTVASNVPGPSPF